MTNDQEDRMIKALEKCAKALDIIGTVLFWILGALIMGGILYAH